MTPAPSPLLAPERVGIRVRVKRAALYLRVSTGDQTCDNQRPALERIARARGAEIVDVFEEQASAARARPKLQALMRAAHRGDFDILVIWALDRLGRSMVGNLQAVLELDRRGVQVVSANEPWLDTGGPVRSLLIAIFGWVAEQERHRIIERTKAGLERVKRQGVRLGRPERRIDLGRARALRDRGATLREVAKELRVPMSTLERALRRRPENGSV